LNCSPGGEHRRRLQESVGQEFNDLLVAFANAEGGTCLFGVEDVSGPDGRHVGRVVGIEISDQMRGRIQSRADTTNEPIDIVIETERNDEGVGIYVVTIKERTKKPYCTGAAAT
jgi:predicted HTH transcriptional regulator